MATLVPGSSAPAHLIPDAPLPFDRLRQADLDVQANIGALRAAGAEYRGLAFHLLLADGRLRLDPFAWIRMRRRETAWKDGGG